MQANSIMSLVGKKKSNKRFKRNKKGSERGMDWSEKEKLEKVRKWIKKK